MARGGPHRPLHVLQGAGVGGGLAAWLGHVILDTQEGTLSSGLLRTSQEHPNFNPRWRRRGAIETPRCPRVHVTEHDEPRQDHEDTEHDAPHNPLRTARTSPDSDASGC